MTRRVLTVSLSSSSSGRVLDPVLKCRGEYTQLLSSGGCRYTTKTAEGARRDGNTQRQPVEICREKERQTGRQEFQRGILEMQWLEIDMEVHT